MAYYAPSGFGGGAVVAGMSKTLTALELAYVALLRTPITVLRVESQGALCALRNAIAFETNRDEEEVQNDYEARANELNMKLVRS